MSNKISVPTMNLGSAINQYNAANRALDNLSDDFDSFQSSNINRASSAQAHADWFNATEAAKQRDFTMAMSSTAHQREVRDLQLAGLNPALSAGGSGAPMGSAAAASSSNALTGVFGSMASTALKAIGDMAQTQLNNSTSMATNANSVNSQVFSTKVNANVATYAAKLQAQTNLSMNAATNAMNERIAQIQSLTSQQVARIAGEYNLSSAQVSAFANKYAAQLAYDANIYSSKAGMKNARLNANTTLEAVNRNNEQSAMNTTGQILGNLAGSIIGAVTGYATAGVPRISYTGFI